MDKGVVVDIGNDIEGFVRSRSSHVRQQAGQQPGGHRVRDDASHMRVLEVDPIHRRIVSA